MSCGAAARHRDSGACVYDEVRGSDFRSGGGVATLDWVHSYNNIRLLEAIDNIAPAEAEAKYFSDRTIERALAEATTLTTQPSQKPGRFREERYLNLILFR